MRKMKRKKPFAAPYAVHRDDDGFIEISFFNLTKSRRSAVYRASRATHSPQRGNGAHIHYEG